MQMTRVDVTRMQKPGMETRLLGTLLLLKCHFALNYRANYLCTAVLLLVRRRVTNPLLQLTEMLVIIHDSRIPDCEYSRSRFSVDAGP